MNAKSVLCDYCGKRFSTKQSKNQHQEMVHRCSNKNNRLPARARNGRRRPANGGNGLSTDIAPSRIPSTRGGTIVISGEDRLGAFDVKAKKSLFLNVDISPAMSQRLATISRAYQRVQWVSVRVIVTPQASAMTNGGYVCGFITDPADRSITARDLTASQGSQTKKFYETAVVNMPRKADLLYTNVGEDPRLSIPASFWVISEGAPSADLTLILTVIWNVKLSVPTLEDFQQASFTLNGELRPKPDNYNLSYYAPGSKSGVDDFSSQIPPGIREQDGEHFFRVPTFTVEYKEGTGDTGTIQAHFLVYKTSDKKVYYSSNGRDIITTPWQGDVQDDQVLVPCGTFCKYIGQENTCRAVTSSVPKSLFVASSGQTEKLDSLSNKLRRMEQLLRELKNSSLRSLNTSTSSSMEKLEVPDL